MHDNMRSFIIYSCSFLVSFFLSLLTSLLPMIVTQLLSTVVQRILLILRCDVIVMGNLFVRLPGDARKEVDQNAPFPVSEFMTLQGFRIFININNLIRNFFFLIRFALVGLFLMFFALITFGIYKSCKNGTCSKPVESGG